MSSIKSTYTTMKSISNNNQRSKSSMATWWFPLALATIMMIVLLSHSQEVQAGTISASPIGGAALRQSQQHSGDYNNLENLISDLLDDAGNRLKKSKLSSMRQIKQTLRFGRRSDPLMAPTFGPGEQNDQQQGRWSDFYDD